MNSLQILNYASAPFTKDTLPEWMCPTCNKGILLLEEEKFLFEETADSKKNRQQPDWYPEWITFRFTGLLRCENQKCGEYVSFSGNGRVAESGGYDETVDAIVTERCDEFTPIFFLPPINLFTIPEECPNLIQEVIISAFGFFWNDFSACAAKIRTALELLLTHQGVKRYTISKQKRRLLTLHNRLEIYKSAKPEIADHLLAIKWIGNGGSHIDKIEKYDLVDAFELLHYCLSKIYGSQKRINYIAKSINKVKGPLSRHQKPPF